MTRSLRYILAGGLLAVSMAEGAYADGPRLRASRVAADNVVAVAEFYVSALDMKQTRLIERDGAPFEVLLNYGATVEEAAASRQTKLVILLRKPGDPTPSLSNLVFGVPDVDGAVRKAVAAGGTISRPVTTSKTSGARIAFVRDPAGNEIELIEE